MSQRCSNVSAEAASGEGELVIDLDALWGGASGFDASSTDRDEIERRAGEGAAVYGRLTDAGARLLLSWMRPGPDDVLLDVGAGDGRFLVLAVLETAVGRALGVELSRERHRIAERARSALLALADARARAAAARLELVCGDAADAGLDLEAVTLAWLGCTTFSATLLGRLARRLHGCPRLRTLVTSKPLPAGAAIGWRARAELDLATSWSPRTRCTVYARA